MSDDLATYHSTKRVKAGEIIRVHGNSCIVRRADGGELWVPLTNTEAKEAGVGDIYLQEGPRGRVVSETYFRREYATPSSNL